MLKSWRKYIEIIGIVLVLLAYFLNDENLDCYTTFHANKNESHVFEVPHHQILSVVGDKIVSKTRVCKEPCSEIDFC